MNRLDTAKEIMELASKLREQTAVARILAIVVSAVIMSEEGLLLNELMAFKERRMNKAP